MPSEWLGVHGGRSYGPSPRGKSIPGPAVKSLLMDPCSVSSYRLISFSGGTFLRGVQGNPNFFPILVQGDAVDGMSPI